MLTLQTELYKLVTNVDKLSGKLYKLMFNLYENGNNSFKWINYVKSIFDETGNSEIWRVQGNVNLIFFKFNVKQILHDQFIQKWFSDIDNSSRGSFIQNLRLSFVWNRI